MSDPSLADRPETYIDEDIELLRSQLYEGEFMIDTATVDDILVGVSTHRLFALTAEEKDSTTLQSVMLPNVEGFETTAGGKQAYGLRAVRTGMYAVLLLGTGAIVDLDGLISPVATPAGAGIGGVLNMVNRLIELVSFVDEVLLGAGLLFLAGALFFAVKYLASRDRYFEVTVSGSEPIRIPIDSEVRPPIDRLEEALEKASNASVP
jgi:hypothetical protein